MEKGIITIDFGKPCEISAEDMHDILLSLPANTYLHIFRKMNEIINHSCYKENDNE